MLIFGCGYTGLRLARQQVAAGTSVRGIVSTAESVERLERAGVSAMQMDLDSPTTHAEPLQANGPTVYLVPPQASDSTPDADDRRLAHALSNLNTTRLIYVSTTGVYGNRDGARVSEDDAPRPESVRARRRLAAENTLQRFGQSTGTPWIILRVPGIYGPDRLQLATLRARRPMLKPDQAGPGNRIHVDDLVRCIEAALVTPHTGRVFNVGDGNTMTNTEFVSLVAQKLGVDPPPTVDRETMRANATPQAWSFMRESRIVDTTRMRRELGVMPRYTDPADGIAASLAQMKIES
jgi:nucleoside-diphosphate-sugar epimerase